MIIEPEYPGMDDYFRYDVEKFFLFGERPVLPNGDLGPVEVRVSFYMDGLCWYELERPLQTMFWAIKNHIPTSGS